jgi:hypothetical protein
VRGHDQTSRRVQSRAWSGLILVSAFASAVAVVAGSVHGQETPGAEPPRSHASDPIDLAARRVQVWDDAGVRWVYLVGRAAVLQGVDGVRANEALVRITSRTDPAGTVYHLDIHAEGITPTADELAPRRSDRITLTTDHDVSVRSYEPGGCVRLGRAPAGLAILARSGLMPAAPPPDRRAAPPRSLQRRSNPDAPDTPAPVADRATTPIPARPRQPLAPLPAQAVQPPEPAVAAVAEIPPVELPPFQESTAPGRNGSHRASLRPITETSAEVAEPPAEAKVDPAVEPAQFRGGGMYGFDDPANSGRGDMPPPFDPSPLDRAPTAPGNTAPPTTLEPLPGLDGKPAAPARRGSPRAPAGPPSAPILPGSQRITRISPRNGNPDFEVHGLPVVDGVQPIMIRGGVNIVTESPPPGFGKIDISADNAIIWRHVGPNGKAATTAPSGELIEDSRQPLEFYLEGDVIMKQDEEKVAGKADQKTYRAKQAYYDVLTERGIFLEGEADMFAPGLVTPARVFSPRIEQFRPFQPGPDGTGTLGLAQIRADQAMGTGSLFPKPGYRFTSRSIDMTRVPSTDSEPNSGKTVDDPSDPDATEDLTWHIDARQNLFYMGAVPVFYWPRFVADADDLEPPLRRIGFSTNNYFGQQLTTDWNGFRVLGIEKPKNVDIWNLDLDYLSSRTKTFPALGSEIGWFGNDLINDLNDPYHKIRHPTPSWTSDYFGYFDIWGLQDAGRDTLGSGPAIITNNRAAGDVGYQRGGGGNLGAVPPFQDPRGRVTLRHMQRFLPDDEEHHYEDLRMQLEIGFTSDRYFLEEYYKRLFDVGMDQETLAYLIRQKDNWAWTLWGEANLQSWQTETQWLPRLDYYRLGDSLLSATFQDAAPEIGNNQIFRGFTYFQHTGADYANTHTASEVNNPYIFAFMPYDPISNTSGVFQSFRAYTNHELDMPLNFGGILRVVPYLQGQAVGWSDQIDGDPMGRVWGAVGARAEIMAWKAYPWVESELFNVHGLNHKINFEADARAAFSNQRLDAIGVQDDLDDNTYESVRRYFALTNYAGGLLPPQYDPRHLLLRRTLSPITGPTDIQGTINSIHLGVHQRLQTKRGPEAKRRIIDYMTLDLDTTFFPDPSRDNFGKPFGQNMYTWQWFIGDRTSIISTGWFEFWNITGDPIYKTNINRHNDPFGLNVITSGVSLTRPPRGNIFIGYTVIDTGPINTSALNVSATYWLSPKWFGTASEMYDFGNGILLSSMFSLTRIGADYLTIIGLAVDPQRQSYGFSFAISPRMSPNMTLGSGTAGPNTFDSRYAPTQ